MKRNRALIKEILEWAEENVDGPNGCAVKIECYTSAEVNYHVWLCSDAGFAEVKPKVQQGKTPKVIGYSIQRLTWSGHEKLDELRSV